MGASASVGLPADVEQVDHQELVAMYASLKASEGEKGGDPSQTLPSEGKERTSIMVRIFLRDPTHNVPDKFHAQFRVDSKKGAIIKGTRSVTTLNEELEDGWLHN
jgi:hypothetical protein